MNMKYRAVLVLQSGQCKTFKSDYEGFEYGQNKKYDAPKSGDIRRIKIGFLEVPWALYHENVLQAFPSNGTPPPGLTPEDFMNLNGKYLPGVIRRALIEDLQLTRILLFLAVGFSGLSMLLGGFCAFLVYKIAHQIGLI